MVLGARQPLPHGVGQLLGKFGSLNYHCGLGVDRLVGNASHSAGGASTPGAPSRGASTPNLFEHIVEAYTT